MYVDTPMHICIAMQAYIHMHAHMTRRMTARRKCVSRREINVNIIMQWLRLAKIEGRVLPAQRGREYRAEDRGRAGDRRLGGR